MRMMILKSSVLNSATNKQPVDHSRIRIAMNSAQLATEA